MSTERHLHRQTLLLQDAFGVPVWWGASTSKIESFEAVVWGALNPKPSSRETLRSGVRERERERERKREERNRVCERVRRMAVRQVSTTLPSHSVGFMGFVGADLGECCVTNCAPHEAVKLIT